MNALRMALELARAQDHAWARAFSDEGIEGWEPLTVEELEGLGTEAARALIEERCVLGGMSGVMAPEWVGDEIVYVGDDVSWHVGDKAVIRVWWGVRELIGCSVGEEISVWSDSPRLRDVEVLMDLAQAARRAFSPTPWAGLAEAFGAVRHQAYLRERLVSLRAEVAQLAESLGPSWGLSAFLAWAAQVSDP